MLVTLGLIVIVVALVLWHEAIIAALIGAWLLVTGIPVLTWTRGHPWQAVAYVAGYFLVGALWSVVKWWFRETDKVREARAEWKTRNPQPSWRDFIAHRKTDPAAYRSEILWWIACWPFSAIWTLLDDPIRRICRRIYDELQGVYRRITDYVWRERESSR